MPTNSFSFDKEKALQYFASGFNSFLERKHIKAPDIAKEIGLKRSSVYTWKAGRGFPDFQTLSKLLLMGMTTKEVFGDEIEKIEKISELEIEIKGIEERLSTWRIASFNPDSVQIPEDQQKEVENSLVKMIGDNKKEIERLKMELDLLRK